MTFIISECGLKTLDTFAKFLWCKFVTPTANQLQQKKFYDIGLKARGSRHFTLRPPGLLQLKDLQGHSGESVHSL